MRVTNHVLKGLAVADQFGLALVDEDFRRTEASVVLIAHAETVRARIFHHDEVALGDVGGKLALFDPEIGVFAELSAETEHGARMILFPVDVYMVI